MNNPIRTIFTIAAFSAVVILAVGTVILAVKENNKDNEDINELDKKIQELEKQRKEIEKENDETMDAIVKLKKEIMDLASEMGMRDEIYAMINGIRVLK